VHVLGAVDRDAGFAVADPDLVDEVVEVRVVATNPVYGYEMYLFVA